jgi:transmembrane sensor
MKESLPDYSDEQAYRIAYLIAGYIRKTLTVQEHDELDTWVEASDENMKLFEDLTDEDNIAANLAWMDGTQTEKALKKAKEGLTFSDKQKNKSPFIWQPYIIAASVILVIAALFLLKSESIWSPKAADKLPTSRLDIPPGGARATLTLGDGTTVDLQSASIGTIKKGKGTTVQKKAEGELMYDNLNEVKELTFNTLSTPKGGQYSVVLSDGTKVWLNAQSSLKFPVQFADTGRVVELSGEGYFEVAKDKARPFVVRTSSKEEIRVLGTQFNVMAYGNEKTRKVTLVEGRVQITGPKKQLQLKPGQQAMLEANDILLNNKTDMDAAIGWKKGEFVFHDANIYELMRQVERWYDVNVIFKTTTSEHFNATIARNEPVSKLIHLLELTGKIHFKIENKTIYVLP